MTPGSEGMVYALSRGLLPLTVEILGIGWNDKDRYDSFPDWGFPAEVNDNGNKRMVKLSTGLVIPSYRRQEITGVKVRRADWKPGDEVRKIVGPKGYVPGMFISNPEPLPIVVVESEIDAALLWQEAGGLIRPLALGSASNKPDAGITDRLRAAGRILVALDNDPAGEEAVPWWIENFSQAMRLKPLKGKDVGDMIKEPGLVRKWVQYALSKPMLEPTSSSSNKRSDLISVAPSSPILSHDKLSIVIGSAYAAMQVSGS